MRRLFDLDEEREFVADLRYLSRALAGICQARFGSSLRAKRRRALVRRLLKDNAMLELGLQIALHADDPAQEDYALVSQIHAARRRRLAEESASQLELRKLGRERASRRRAK